MSHSIMRLYEAETGGAVYWIAAPTVPSAMATLLACWKSQGMADDEVTSLGIRDVTDLPKATRLVLRADGGDGPNVKMLDEVAATFTPTVLSCSEWP